MKSFPALRIRLPLGALVAVGMIFVQPLRASWTLVDNFDGYTIGTNGTALTPPWLQGFTGVPASALTTTAVNTSVLAASGQGLIFTYAGAGGMMNTSTGSTIAADNTTGTLFFQAGFSNFGSDTFFGIGLSGATAYAGVSAIARVLGSGVLQVYTGNGSGGGTYAATTTPITLSLNTVYSFWMVVNNTANSFDLYYAVGGGTAILAQSGITFRAASAGNLDTFYVGTNSGSGLVLDNTYMDVTGANLVNPAPVPEPSGVALACVGLGLLIFGRHRVRRC